jgi:hypothetical protein
MTVLQVGKLITDHQQLLCLIRSISESGVLIRSSSPLVNGQELAVEFRSGHRLLGHVDRRQGLNARVVVADKIDVTALMAAQNRLQNDHYLPEAVRLEVHSAAIVEVAHRQEATELFDISLAGAKVGDLDALVLGGKVALVVPGLPHRSAVVRWRKGGKAGLAFNLAMPFEVLEQWVLTQVPRVTLTSLRSDSAGRP